MMSCCLPKKSLVIFHIEVSDFNKNLRPFKSFSIPIDSGIQSKVYVLEMSPENMQATSSNEIDSYHVSDFI